MEWLVRIEGLERITKFAQQIVLEDAVTIVLCYPVRGIAALRTVDDLAVSPVGLLPLDAVQYESS